MINKDKIAFNFTQAQDTYATNAIVQKRMGEKICQLLNLFIQERKLKVCDLGAGAGANLSLQYSKSLTSKIDLTLVDLVELKQEVKEALLNHQFVGDLQKIKADLVLWCKETHKTKYDLILSNATLQWVENPQGLLKDIFDNLIQENGVLAFSTFAKDNFIELKSLTENSLTYYSKEEWLKFLDNAGFKVLVAQEFQSKLYFEVLKDLFSHLKLTGVNNLKTSAHWTKTKLLDFYKGFEQFKVGKHYPLTYRPLIFICVKN
ncbi:hypothetical protein CKF54_01600 [Psittacicella hinzii]|uniref:Malonyl-[acyl-carrier protein] O-methyltransferase n=1 Tax=Psittacicella hinzii TaxID=2028575 RepID=A0A3A1Y7D9_9GAMM|nr:methyltransferase domain-containing protein [Psittacicella hinzii]RIY34152.1 hypothetical protein CKF54_01600 [Psittacicella hinzii]